MPNANTLCALSEAHRKKAETYSKMTDAEREAYFEAFGAIGQALDLKPSYERALALQRAKNLVARMRVVMAEAETRPSPDRG